MPRTRNKIRQRQIAQEPKDHLGREVKTFGEIQAEVLEAVAKEKKKSKKEDEDE